jgi:hypothetical protein
VPQVPLGATLNLAAATRTLTFAQLASLAWRRGNPPYAGGAFPWGDPPLSALTEWIAGYLDTQASWMPDAPQSNYPAWASLADEAEVYPNGDAIALGSNPFSVVAGQLVVQPRLLTPAETATLAPTPFLAGRTWLSGAGCTAPFSQTYGYFSFTAKLPAITPGIWPAFWLLPVSGAWPPEIDILEAVAPSGALQMTTSVHTNDAAWHAANPEDTGVVPVGFDPAAAFHEYGALVEADFITTFWDRKAVRCVPTPSDIVGAPLYMIFDFAIGGTGSWPGPLPAGTKTVPPLVISDVGAWSGAISAGAAVPPASAPNAAALALIASAQADLAAAAKLL